MATILIVDDLSTNRKFLVTLLAHHGHRLLEAADGREALAAVQAERPDLVITDVLMPVMDGYEFVRQLRLNPDTGGIPVVFYTAHYGEREARELARSSGVAYVLTKPAGSAEVLAIVGRVLAGEPGPARHAGRQAARGGGRSRSPSVGHRQAVGDDRRPESRQRAVASGDQYRVGARVRTRLRPSASQRLRGRTRAVWRDLRHARPSRSE